MNRDYHPAEMPIADKSDIGFVRTGLTTDRARKRQVISAHESWINVPGSVAYHKGGAVELRHRARSATC